MSSTKSPTRRRRVLATTVSRYLLPFVVCLSAAALWLILISTVTEATGSYILVLAMAVLPGTVLMGISRRERGHWFEYVLVWIGFFTAVPLYGIVLLIGGYGIVLARAWRRHQPHSAQHADG